MRFLQSIQSTDSTSHPLGRCLFWLLILLLCACGCASPPKAGSLTPARHFELSRDAFAYANETVWEYRADPLTGVVTHHRRETPPAYSHRCFIMARAARQFFEHASWLPDRPRTTAQEYQRLVRQVMARNPRRAPTTDQIQIPGYANLRSFSRDYAELLKANCGSGIASYFQRGNWRMIFPFSRRHQQSTAEKLLAELGKRPAIVHLVRFPSLTINHGVLLFEAKEQGRDIVFSAYDPNDPEHALLVHYHRERDRFSLPPIAYFAGDWVNVYQIYCGWNY